MTIKTKVWAVAVISVVFFSMCKTARYADAPKPAEQYNYVEEPPVPSTLTIPIDISIQDLINNINNRLPAVLYEDNSYDDNGSDGLLVRAEKSRAIDLHFSGNTIKYRIPLKLWVKQKLLFTSAEAEGELALNFKTTFELKTDWSIATSTEVEYHEWLVRPVLKTGLGSVNIEPIANIALNRSKRSLTQTLDRFVAQQISLRPYVEEVWTALQAPTLLSDEYQLWIKTTPLSIAITPITTDWRSIRTKVSVETLNDVSVGPQPTFRSNAPLPALRLIQEAPDDFQMRISTDVPFAEAERFARAEAVGQEFASGKKKVRVEDLQLWGSNDKLVINTKLSGAFNGNIYFIGRPVYNAAKNQVEVADLDFHLDTRNFLFKSASWLFQGTIRRKMQDAMTFPLDQNMTELKTSIQETLNHYELDPGVVLTGVLDSMTVENTKITPSGIRVNLFGSGRVKVEIK